MAIAIVLILGLCVGSFLNVCIYRLPLGKPVNKPPRSFCPRCDHVISWYDNIPIVSFLILRAKCRSCGGRISFVYPFVELLTAGAFFSLYSRFGLGFESVSYAVLSCGLIVATFVDLKHRIIPDEVSIGGIIAGFVFNHNIDSLLGILIGGGVIYLTGLLGDFIFKKETMGGGDVKLLAMIGAFLGYKKALFTFFAAPFFGTAVGVYILLKKKDHTIPYGPFLSLAALVSIFWYEPIMRLIFPVYF
ncbi:MAG: prepilin peptidase [Candidatus Omnitrophica bacterium]|nr:prepilin peptidase [Candidatus Omnitrophota bacterium]